MEIPVVVEVNMVTLKKRHITIRVKVEFRFIPYANLRIGRQYLQGLEQVIKMAESISGFPLPNLFDIHSGCLLTRATNTRSDHSHSGHSLFINLHHTHKQSMEQLFPWSCGQIPETIDGCSGDIKQQ